MSYLDGPGNPACSIQRLNYGSNQKSVNTKVVPVNELINIVIEHFPQIDICGQMRPPYDF